MDLTSLSLAPLKTNHNITNLQCAFGDIDICSIAEILHINTTLETLSIGEVEFIHGSETNSVSVDQTAFTALSDALKVNRSLKVLKLNCETHKLARERVRALIGALQYNQTLERLELPRKWNNNFSGEAVDSRVIFSLY